MNVSKSRLEIGEEIMPQASAAVDARGGDSDSVPVSNF